MTVSANPVLGSAPRCWFCANRRYADADNLERLIQFRHGSAHLDPGVAAGDHPRAGTTIVQHMLGNQGSIVQMPIVV